MGQVRFAWKDGRIVDWEKATVHVYGALEFTATGIFEGIRAYWNPERKQLNVFRLDDHLRRLYDSAKIHRIQIPYALEELRNAFVELQVKNDFKENTYARPTVYRETQLKGAVAAGGETERKSDVHVAIVAYPRGSNLDKEQPPVVNCNISSWRKMPDDVQPARAKSLANYFLFGVVPAESKFDETILLTVTGKVSETAGGTNVFIVKNGTLITPSTDSDILEGITRDCILKTAPEVLQIKVLEKTVDKSELYLADEAFICGTGGGEVTPILSVDNLPVGDGNPGAITMKVRKLYTDLVLGNIPRYSNFLTPVY